MKVGISVNGKTYSAKAFKAGAGVVFYVTRVKGLRAPAFEELFQEVPDEHVGGGWVESGRWDGNRKAFDNTVDFLVGPDGAVWAKICSSPEELPKMSDYKGPGNLSPHLQADIQRRLRAFRILEEAEEARGVITMAREEAAVDGWALPVSVEDYLFWVEDEALI